MKTLMEWIDANTTDATLLILLVAILGLSIALNRHVALIEERKSRNTSQRKGFNRAYL